IDRHFVVFHHGVGDVLAKRLLLLSGAVARGKNNDFWHRRSPVCALDTHYNVNISGINTLSGKACAPSQTVERTALLQRRFSRISERTYIHRGLYERSFQ